MARTFSMAYDNDPDGFQKRVMATLEAQSLAIAAALSLAARQRGRPVADEYTRLAELDKASTNSIFPINERDRLYAQHYLGEIFAEAERLLAIEHPWESGQAAK